MPIHHQPHDYHRRDRSISRSRSRSPPRRRAIDNGNGTKQSPSEETDEIIKNLGSDEVCRLLTSAVESLYEDRIRPVGLYVRGRLKEKSSPEKMVRNYLEFFPRFPAVFRVFKEPSASQQEETVIELVNPPSWFKGWINIDDPEDKYEETMWQDFAEHLKSGHEFAGGRYGMARELQSRKLPFLEDMCLGEICNVVQLAIGTRKLVVYHKKLLKTLDRAEAGGIVGKSTRTNGNDFKNVQDLPELCEILFRLYIRRNRTPLRLEQLRNMMQKEFSLTVSEMDFKCAKLSEVMKLEPLKSAFVLNSDNGSMRLTLSDPGQFAADIRHRYARAEELERPSR